MPYYRNKKLRFYGKKKKRQTQTRALVTRNSPNQVFPFPNHYYCKMKYATMDSLTNSGYTPGSYTWRVNSLYDPDYTSTGHQPRGFDQIMSANGPYYRYLVTGCMLEAVVSNMSTTSVADVWLTVFPGSTTAPTTLQEAHERSKFDTVIKRVAQVGSGNTVRLKKYISIAKLFGVQKKMIIDNLDYTAPYNNSPAQTGYATLAMSTVTGADITCYFTCELTFYCKLTQVCDVPDS